MKLKNFYEIKAIDEARAIKIIKWYHKTPYGVAVMAGGGCTLDSASLIELLSIFGNSKNLERDISSLANRLLGCEEIEENQ